MIVLGGLLNMGVFLRIGGEFLVQVTGFPAGSSGAPVWPPGCRSHLELTMTALLLMVAVYTILGGMLSVLVTDFLQFIVMSAGLIAVTVLILVKVGWGRLVATVQAAPRRRRLQSLRQPADGLAVRPLQRPAQPGRGADLADDHLPRAGGQGHQDRAEGLHPHQLLLRLPLPHPRHLGHRRPGRAGRPWSAATRLHAMPLFLSTFVPVGLMGLLVAAMLAADMSTDSSYMLTWGSVIYNDILAPFRKTQLVGEAAACSGTALIVAVIGVFLLVYGLWYPLQGRPVDLPGRHRHDLPVQHVDAADRLLLLEAGQQLGRRRGHRRRGRSCPSSTWCWSRCPPPRPGCAATSAPTISGIATYLLAGAAMVVGSLLKPARRGVTE